MLASEMRLRIMEMAERFLNSEHMELPLNKEGEPMTLGDVLDGIEAYVFVDDLEEEEED